MFENRSLDNVLGHLYGPGDGKTFEGVFAIAITLLILVIAVHPPGTQLAQVLHAKPSHLGYVVSFLTSALRGSPTVT